MLALPLLAAAALAAGQAAPAAGAPLPEIELAGPELGAVRTPSAPGAWGGPRTGAEPTLSDRVADHTLRAVLDPVKHTIDGTARLTWRNRSAVPVSSLYFHLYLNAFESEGSTFMVEKRRYGKFRSGVELEDEEWGRIELRSVTQGGREAAQAYVHPDGGPETDHTVVRVDLPEPVPPGGTTTLELAFFDQLPRVLARTGWFGTFHLAGQWYPKIGVLELPGERGATRPRWNCHEFHLNSEFYADFGAYDLEVVVPAGYTVAASGVRQGAPAAGKDGLVTHRFRAEDVHDVVFAAWDGFAPPLAGTWTGPGSPEVQVEVFFPPEFEASARETLAATLASLDFFSRTLGPYPYPHVTVVIPPHNAEEAGGMEYETFFTNLGSNQLPTNAEGLVGYVAVHEFGHGYFMGLLASNEFEEPFLDEGLNEWWDARMLVGQPVRATMPAWLRALGLEAVALEVWDYERLVAKDPHPADPIAGNSWHRFSGRSYGAVYSRTAVAFRDLEALIGEERTAAAMKLYYARWRHRHPSTADLLQAFVDAAPGDEEQVRRWFDEQVFAATPVDDRIVTLQATEDLPAVGSVAGPGGARVELTQAARAKQVEEARAAWRKAHDGARPDPAKPGPFRWRSVVKAQRLAAHVPRTVILTFEDGTTETFAWPTGERWTRIEVVRDTPVKEATLGPAGGYQLDLGRLDDGLTRKPERGRSSRLALAAEGYLRVLLALVEAL